MAAKRPTKRKLETGTEKVMRAGAPREAVTRVNRGGDVPAESSATDDTEAPLSGTKARRAAQADKGGEKSTRRSRRVTAKGTGSPATSSSGRYTPPTTHYDQMPSPLWVPILMFTMWALGMLTIILNYVDLLPGGTNNWYLLLGLAFILGGIITATQYR